MGEPARRWEEPDWTKTVIVSGDDNRVRCYAFVC